MRLISFFTCLAFIFYSTSVAAFDLENTFSGRSAGQAEYFNSNKDKRMVIQVSILSGVARPGMHQFPDTTNLVDALALAGGLTPEADFEKVYIKRRIAGNKSKFETLKFDVSDLVREDALTYPVLQNYDTILVEPRPKTDQKLITILTIVASTVGIVSGVFLVRRLSKD